ncbi:MAG: hypothetical protein QOJ39_3918, partial [Candidatus Eremiobacteraeota bacterium]|nr:hypothetical protein [Candidatus Eremiobacteraeota bacterium]
HAPSARNTRAPGHGVRAAAAVRADAGAVERRIPTELARSIERGVARRGPGAGTAARGGSASFTVNVAGGRVHLLVRSDGACTRVVAVCAPLLRERVERALAHVRFALAGAGMRAEVA